jgi:hypothetical protein
MKLNLKARDWHNWVSVVLVVPMLLIGFTSIFLAHKKTLGLNELDLTAWVAWLPGYRDGVRHARAPEIRSTAVLPDGRTLVGTHNGLFVLASDGPRTVVELGGDQVRDIAVAPWGVVVAAKGGVWLEQQGAWARVLDGDAWNAVVNPDGSVTVALKDRDPMTSADGAGWTRTALAAELERVPADAIPRERVTLGKLMIDLHTGKALLGKDGEWIWIDLLGFVWVFLGFTGLWLWWRTQTKRRDAAQKRVLQLPGTTDG